MQINANIPPSLYSRPGADGVKASALETPVAGARPDAPAVKLELSERASAPGQDPVDAPNFDELASQLQPPDKAKELASSLAGSAAPVELKLFTLRLMLAKATSIPAEIQRARLEAGSPDQPDLEAVAAEQLATENGTRPPLEAGGLVQVTDGQVYSVTATVPGGDGPPTLTGVEQKPHPGEVPRDAPVIVFGGTSGELGQALTAGGQGAATAPILGAQHAAVAHASRGGEPQTAPRPFKTGGGAPQAVHPTATAVSATPPQLPQAVTPAPAPQTAHVDIHA
jgi:hypothetical protein